MKIKQWINEKMGINLDARFSNPQYWFMIGMAIIVPIASYMGINASDITSWGTLWNMLGEAIANPYLLMMVVANVYNATVDGTTKGFKDSQMVLKGENSTDLRHEIEELKDIIEQIEVKEKE